MKIRRKWLVVAIAIATLCLAAFAFWAARRTPFGQGRVEVVYSEKALGPNATAGDHFISTDLMHLTYVMRSNGKDVVVRDGVAGAPYDRAMLAGDLRRLTTAPSGEHIVYEALRGDDWFLVVDGAEIGPYDSIRALTGSRDGSRVAYCARRKGESWLKVVELLDRGTQDIAEVPVFDVIQCGAWSLEGHRLACAIERDGWRWLWVDGDEFGPFSNVIQCAWSPKGNRLACAIERDGGRWVWVDGKEFGPYVEETRPSWRPRAKRFWGMVGMVGRREPGGLIAYEAITEDTVPTPAEDAIWSPDGKGLAYAVRRDGKQCYVADGVVGKVYNRVSEGTFSPDAQHFAYVAHAVPPTQAFVVIDGKEGPRYPSVEQLRLGRDGHFAYVASKGSKQFVVRDGAEGKEYCNVWDPTFAPDGSTVSYMAVLADGSSVCVLGLLEGYPGAEGCGGGDGNPNWAFDGIKAGPGPYWALGGIKVSPDSKHMACTIGSASTLQHLEDRVNSWLGSPILTWQFPAPTPSQSHVCLDGAIGPPCDFATDVMFTPDGHHAAYAAEINGKIFLVVDGRKYRDIEGSNILAARVVGDSLRIIVARGSQLVLAEVRLKSM